jgi:flagellar hook assembly protein FlgD
LYDVAGRLVRTIKNKELCLPGYYTVLWDAKDDLGRKVSAGVYFVQLVIDPVGKTEDYKGVQKIVLLQ